MIPNEDPAIADSLWTATAGPSPDCPPLIGEAEADLVVIGGGYTGLSAALHAAEAGLTAVVLEAQAPGWGASGRNGGQVNPGFKHDPDEVEVRFGPEAGGRLLRLASTAGDRLFELIARHGIDCDVQRAGWILTAVNEAGMAAARARVAAWARYGVGMQNLDRAAIAGLLGFDAYMGGMVDPRGGTVHPLKLAYGMCRAAQGLGVRVHSQSPALRMDSGPERVTVHTGEGRVTAARAVIAVNGYGDAFAGRLARSVVPLRSIQVATEPLPAELRARLFPGGHHASDTQRLMKYFRLSPDGRFVIGGRGRFRDRAVCDDFEALRRAAVRMCPDLAGVGWDYAWGGNIAITMDHYPHLHLPDPRVAAVLGYNGRGVAMATVMGSVLAGWAGGAPGAELSVPVTPLRTIPFHVFRNLGVELTIAKYRVLDALGL